MRTVETDAELLHRLRDGDEDAFVTLVGRYQEPMVRFASSFVPNRAIAEEAVQDTWMGVVRGIDRFEERSTFKTWLFAILINRARSAGSKEHRQHDASSDDQQRFDSRGAWLEPVERWVDETDERLDAATLVPVLRSALDTLAPQQRQVVLLRDLEGLSGPEVCDVLGISAGNQRLLLHRGRNQLRDLLDAAVKEA